MQSLLYPLSGALKSPGAGSAGGGGGGGSSGFSKMAMSALKGSQKESAMAALSGANGTGAPEGAKLGEEEDPIERAEREFFEMINKVRGFACELFQK